MKRIPNPARLESRCREFNAKNPIGTLVEYHSVIGEEASIRTKTRSEAYVLSGHTAVIFLENVFGCVSLDAVEIATGGGRDMKIPVCPACRQKQTLKLVDILTGPEFASVAAIRCMKVNGGCGQVFPVFKMEVCGPTGHVVDLYRDENEPEKTKLEHDAVLSNVPREREQKSLPKITYQRKRK